MTTKFVAHGGWIGADTCTETGRPWIRPGAAEYIESLMPEGANVFEWGSGSSTIWLARMGCAVTSVELDHEWVISVKDWLAREGLTARILDFSPKNPLNLKESADVILKEPDCTFDFVLVDGRNRNRCLANARSKVKIGGILCLDNSEREEYTEAVKLMDTWEGYSYGDSGWLSTCYVRLPESDVTFVEFETEDA